MKLALLLTGNEIMSGDIVDSNSAMIAQYLSDFGWAIAYKSTIGDNLDLIIQEIKRLSNEYDILIVNGGLGPTVDDLTAEALSIACNTPLVEHPDAYAHLSTWCQKLNIPLSQSNLKQAMLPKGCGIIANPIGSAVGFTARLNDCLVICTPGVPKELQAMLQGSILPLISEHFSPESYHTHKITTFGLGEATLQEMINQHLTPWPTEITLGFRASNPTVEIKLTTSNRADLTSSKLWKDKVITLLGENYIGDNGVTLAEAAINSCKALRKTLVCAESCSGGMIASQLTQVAGASEVFLAGLVTYSNHMKTEILNVPTELIQQHGAVSEQVAIAMAQGALNKSDADIVITTTGVAGPGGGSLEKPVGSVWICWGTRDQLHTAYLLINGDRVRFQQWLTAIALDLIRRTANNQSPTPTYLSRHTHPQIRTNT